MNVGSMEELEWHAMVLSFPARYSAIIYSFNANAKGHNSM